MKKTLLTILIGIALISPTLSYSVPAAAKLLFDVAMFAANARTTPTHWKTVRQSNYTSATFLHFGLYVYTLPQMYSAFLKATRAAAIVK